MVCPLDMVGHLGRGGALVEDGIRKYNESPALGDQGELICRQPGPSPVGLT